MLAVVTGCSSGIGLEVCRALADRGYSVIGCSRHEGGFKEIRELHPDLGMEFISSDLSTREGIDRLWDEVKDRNIDLFFANAGFGCFGDFTHEDLDQREVEMAELNCLSTQILIKRFLRKFHREGRGRVMVTASAAAFGPMPYMASYCATKSYVYRLCRGYQQELRELRSKASLSILCPGPVATGFEKAGNLKFQMKPTTPERVARYAVPRWLKGKRIIVPGLLMKLARFGSKLCPDWIIVKVTKRAAV